MGSEKFYGRVFVDGRHVINAAIVLLSLLVLFLSGGAGWRAWLEYQAARDVALAQEVAGEFVEAATFRALERTYTDAALGARGRAERAFAAGLTEAREQGDALWRQAIQGAGELAGRVSEPSELVGKIRSAQIGQGALRAARGQVDHCLAGRRCEIDVASWQHAINQLIQSSALVREAVFMSLDTPRHVSQLLLTLRRWVWTVNEHSRQERGLIAYHLASRDQAASAITTKLSESRGIVAYALEDLVAIRQARHIDPRITQAITHADQALRGGLWPLQHAVLDGDGAMDAGAWLEKTRPAMAALKQLNSAISTVIEEQAQQARTDSHRLLVWSGLYILLSMAVTLFSMTKVRQIANALFHQKELAEVTIRSIGDAVITTNVTGYVEYLNPVAERMTGWKNIEARGRPLRDVFNIVDGVTLQPQTNPMDTCLRENRVVGLDNNTVLIRRDGGRHYIEDSAAPIRDREGHLAGGVLVFYDTTEAHQAGHLIAYHSTHDSLTGLINRREFEHRLAALLVRSTANAERHALLYMDLDQFKVVNDTCGHMVGDRLVREVSQALRAQVRDSDVLARVGGDEYGLLLENCSLERALSIAEAIRAAVADIRFTWEESSFDVRLSIGLVPFGGDSGSPAALLGQADAACNVAKEKGRDRIQIYEPGNMDMARRHGEMQWVSRITKALAEDRFQLYCQPIKPIAAAGIPHGEVLVRMLDEEGKLIPPGDFIPSAERFGLMPAIDRWVIRNAMHTLGERYRKGEGEQAGVLAINLSGATLGDEALEAFLLGEMAMTAVPHSALCFEITETAAVGNLAEAAHLIRVLKITGCSFALDDFGSGMSSFMYLKQLPVDYLKIDGSFVRNIESDRISLAMVQSIHTVGKAMGIRTIAEYVENDAILRRLEKMGVDYAQGYAVGRPEPLDSYLDGLGTAG